MALCWTAVVYEEAEGRKESEEGLAKMEILFLLGLILNGKAWYDLDRADRERQMHDMQLHVITACIGVYLMNPAIFEATRTDD